MRTDPDTIRALLIDIANRPAGPSFNANELPTVQSLSNAEAFEYLQNLQDAGLVAIKALRASHTGQGGGIVQIERLTHAGQEFVRTIENDTVWAKVKEQTAKHGGSASLGVLVQLAAAAAKAVFGL